MRTRRSANEVWRGGVLAVCLLAAAAGASAQSDQDAFFDGRVLQDVRLSIRPADWQTLKDTYDENTYYPADFTWRGQTARNVGIRSRGTGTRNGIKPGLRVDFNRYLSNQEFAGLKAVELKNMYTDASLVRETVAMQLYARFGLAVPREAHARLFVNDVFAGVYVIVESIDRMFVARTFGDAEASLEHGGYLFEYKWQFPYGFEDLGADLLLVDPARPAPSLRGDDQAADDVRPADDADETAALHHDGAADVGVEHDDGALFDGGGGRDRDQRIGGIYLPGDLE